MASRDAGQLTTVLQRLGDGLALLNPVKLVSVSRAALHELGTPPPGDPAALRALAETFRAAGTAAEPLPADVRRLDATSAAQVVLATAAALGRAQQAFRMAATALDTLADRIEAQQHTHAELRRKLHDAVHDATHLGRVPAPDPTALDDLTRAAAALIHGCIRVYTDAIEAADQAAAVFADVAGAARAGAGAGGGLPAPDAVVLAAHGLTTSHYSGEGGQEGGHEGGHGGGYDGGVLTVAQLHRAGQRLAGLPADDAATVRTVLDDAESGTERAYLLKAVAAGHGAAGLAAFAAAIRGRDERWLHDHLSLIDRGGPGGQDRFGAEVDQCDGYTCGTTSAIVALAEADPVYTLTLTAGLEPPYDQADRDEFDRRLTAEQRRVHAKTNTVWPRRFGTLPAGIADWLNEHSGATGVRYRWHLVDDTDRRDVSEALREVVTAVDGGHPVPVLVGGPVPRHYVLAVGHAGDDLLIFEPTSGDTIRVPAADFVNGALRDEAGFDHVQAVIVPRGPSDDVEFPH